MQNPIANQDLFVFVIFVFNVGMYRDFNLDVDFVGGLGLRHSLSIFLSLSRFFKFIFVSQHFFSCFLRTFSQKTTKKNKNQKKIRKLISFFCLCFITPFNRYLSKSFTQSLLNILSNPLSVKMQLRSRVIVIESQTQSQTQIKRTRTPSQKAIESKESKKALAAMDAQNLQQKLQQLREIQESQTPKPISKRFRTLSLKEIEAQENKTFMETLDAEEAQQQQQQQQQQSQTENKNRYETRSKNTNKTPYSIAEFNQDFFNDASIAWRENKIQTANATFKYRCSERLKNVKRCVKSPYN